MISNLGYKIIIKKQTKRPDKIRVQSKKFLIIKT